MAAFVRTSFTNNYRNLDPSKTLLNEAIAGGSAQNLKSLMQVLRQPDFIIEGTTDSNTAALTGGAAQSYLVNLSDEGGVSFPAGYDRDIIIEAWTNDETGPNYQKILQTVRGSASAPAATGGVRNLGPKVGGRITFATAAATAADAYGGFSITAAATATGRYAAAIPKARRVIPTTLHVTHVGTGDLSAVATSLHLNALTLATGVIELGFREGLDANVAPGDTAQAVVEFDVLPVESPELAFDTTTTPDEVLVGAVGQASENVNWLVHVYVGPLRSNAAATASE
jgi:hypothetical protein